MARRTRMDSNVLLSIRLAGKCLAAGRVLAVVRLHALMSAFVAAPVRVTSKLALTHRAIVRLLSCKNKVVSRWSM